MDQNQLRQSPIQGSAGGSVHDQQDASDLRIEDMPLDKKLEVLRKYNGLDMYDDGRFIDAQDSVNSWCLGNIVHVDKNSLNIHFDGWSNKWDVWQKVNSYKIAPFRKYSRGYTGQNKVALRQNLKFSLDDLHLQKQRVEKLIESDLNGLGAFQTTQYLRGTLYIYVDFLLQGGPQQDEQIDAINDFLYCVLRLVVTWLKKLPKLMHLYAQQRVNSDLFLIDENIAILVSSYEILDMLKKIFCCCHRCIKYYILNDKNPLDMPITITKKFDHIKFEQARKKDEEDIDIDEVKDLISTRKNIVFGQFMNFVNYFAEIGGFDAIIDFMKLGNDSQEDKIPLELISQLTLPFRNCIAIFSPSFSQSFVQSVREVVVYRLKNMSEKELKEIDKESVGRVLNDLKDFMTLALTDKETAELIESNMLEIALRFLKSTYLEKRLKGISEIKMMIDRIEYAQKQAQFKNNMVVDQRFNRGSMDNDMIGGMKALKAPKWLTADSLKDWILNEKILDIVLGENTHLEIVKRSSCILKFLAKQGSLPAESIDLIWKSQLGKHEEMVRVVYGLIQELVPYIEIQQIDLLYHKVQQVPASQYDEKFLEFLKDFTQKSLENYYQMKTNEASISETAAISYDDLIQKREVSILSKFAEHIQNPNLDIDADEKQYGLPIFWELIQDKAPQVNNETMQLAINSITEILKQSYSQPIRINYLIKSIDNLIKGESIAQSIIIAQNIIAEYPIFDYQQKEISQKNIIIHLNKQLLLIDKMIQNILAYHQQVKEKVKLYAHQKKNLPEDVSHFVFVGKHTHEITINHILNFLEFLIVNSNQQVSLGTANIDTLWQIFVQQPNFNSDQNMFFKWINLHREAGYEKKEYFIFTDEERKYFFTKILCNPTYVNFQSISIGQVKCFHKYFKVINRQEENLDISRKKMRVVQYDKLIGLDTLWRIAIESENERSREESMDLLVDLHLKFDQVVVMAEQAKIWNNFIEQCMRNLESDNDHLVTHTIQLLSRFLDRYEGKKALKPEFKQSHFTNLQPLNITVMNRNDQSRRNVHISYFQTIGFLRLKIAEAFNFQINEFSMNIKNSYVDPDDDDDKYIKEIGLIQNVIIQKNNLYSPENHPKFIISNNPLNYEKFFYLLSKEKPQLIETTWDLLQKLPINTKLSQEIKDLSGIAESQKNWEKILDPSSTNKLLYSLKIINGLYQNKKDQKVTQWRYKFVSMGGFTHLLKTFISLDIKTIETSLTMKCIELLIVILYDFLTSDKDLIKQVMDQKDFVVLKSINLIDLICDYTISVEKKRGISYEEITKRIQQNKQKKNKYKSYMANNTKQGENKQQQQAAPEDEDDQESQEYNQMQTMVKQFAEDSQIVVNLFKFLFFTVFNHDPTTVTLIVKYQNLEDLLYKSTILTENWYIRIEIIRKLKEILTLRSNTPDMIILQEVIAILYFKIQNKTEHNESRCFNFFEGTTHILDSQTIQDIEPQAPQFENLIFETTHFILNREIQEKNTLDQDTLLTGKMKLLKSLLMKFAHLKEKVGQILTDHLLHNCLFEVPQGGTTKNQNKAGPPKCKAPTSRQQASRLLAVLCRDCIPNLVKVLTYMQQFNQNPSWRTNKDHDWQISLMDSEKSSTGYVGIKNLGCICYMNSLFQQLFMIQSFRNDLLSVKDQSGEQVEKEENMLYQLQILFAGLLKSEKQYVSPKGFCHAFKDWEGQPTNVLEQMDVEEFFNMLMDRIETAIKGSPQQNTIQHHFGGKFASEMICQGCPHKYERSEPFMSISIPVKNKKSILEGLTAFIQGDMLEGDNQYLCEKCDKKVDALKRTCVKRLPRYLNIALRRFEFDYDKMVRVKVNDYCEFPMEFSMEPYTQEGLARREKHQKMTEEKGEDAGEEEIEMDPLKYPKEYYEYSLSGIVVHSGTADSGHYYSFIKDRDHPESGKWYELNDHIVRDFDPNDIPQETFGGEDTFQGYNMVQMKSMKWRNAYLLFYERKTPIDIPSDDEAEKDKTNSRNKEDVEMTAAHSSQEINILSDIEEKIAYENQKYWQNRFLFGNEYHEFVYDLSLNWNTNCIIPRNFLTKNNDFHLLNFPMPKEYERDLNVPEALDIKIPLNTAQLPEIEEQVFKYATGFYITILQRSQNKTYIPQMLNLLKGYINKNYNCASWIVSEFCNYKIIEENLLFCTSKEMRKFIVGLLYCAMLKLYPVEKDQINDYWLNHNDPNNNKTVIGNFALVLIQNIFQVKKFVANCSQYFQLLARFSSLGGEAREFLLRARTVGRLMQFFFDDVSPHKEHFRDFSDINPKYKLKPEIGLPTEIDRKQMSQFQEILEKRRMKNLADAPAKYKYLIETVSNCIRGFKNGEAKTPYQLDDGNFEALQAQERDLFIPDSKFLKKVFFEARKNRSLNFVCQGYCHFAWQEKEAFQELMGTIQLGLNDNDFDELKPTLMLLQFLLQRPGNEDVANQRFETLMLVFLEGVKANQNFYKFMESIFDFIFKISCRIPKVREWFKVKKNQWQWLAEWADSTKFPYNPMMDSSQSSLRVYKKRNNIQLHSQFLKSEAFKNQVVRDARLKRLEQLIKGEQPDLSQEIDIDIVDLQDYKFIVGEQIEIYYRRTDNLKYAQVEQVLDEMLQVKMLNNNVNNNNQDNYQNANNLQWIGCDTDKLFLHNTYKSQYRIKMIDFMQNHFDKQRKESSNITRGQGGNPNDMEYDDNNGAQYGGQQNYGSDDDDNDSDQPDLYS